MISIKVSATETFCHVGGCIWRAIFYVKATKLHSGKCTSIALLSSHSFAKSWVLFSPCTKYHKRARRVKFHPELTNYKLQTSEIMNSVLKIFLPTPPQTTETSKTQWAELLTCRWKFNKSALFSLFNGDLCHFSKRIVASAVGQKLDKRPWESLMFGRTSRNIIMALMMRYPPIILRANTMCKMMMACLKKPFLLPTSILCVLCSAETWATFIMCISSAAELRWREIQKAFLTLQQWEIILWIAAMGIQCGPIPGWLQPQ